MHGRTPLFYFKCFLPQFPMLALVPSLSAESVTLRSNNTGDANRKMRIIFCACTCVDGKQRDLVSGEYITKPARTNQ